jgi:hypothetical protein
VQGFCKGVREWNARQSSPRMLGLWCEHRPSEAVVRAFGYDDVVVRKEDAQTK